MTDKPKRSDPARRLWDFQNAIAAQQIMQSPNFGEHLGGLMRGDMDPERKVSTDQLTPTIGEAADLLIQAFQPIIASSAVSVVPEPLPEMDAETSQDSGLPIERMPEIDSGDSESAKVQAESPLAGVAEEPSLVQPPQPLDLPPAETPSVVEAELPAVDSSSDPVASGQSIVFGGPIQTQQSPAAPLPSPSRQAVSAAPPPPIASGTAEPPPVARSFSPFLSQGGPIPVSPTDTLGVMPPPPSPAWQGTGSVMFDHSNKEPVILRDPAGTLVDRQYTGSEQLQHDGYREMESAVNSATYRASELTKVMVRRILQLSDDFALLRDSLASEGTDEQT